MTTSVLFVCLGNICRSPTAEGVTRIWRRSKSRRWPSRSISAGTGGYHIGAPPDPRSQDVAQRRGIDISGLRARRVAPEDYAKFDLMLAMDRANLSALERSRPRHSRAQLQLFLE